MSKTVSKNWLRTVTTTTFRDFSWRSRHRIAPKRGAASHYHWHTYRARFYFKGPIDQDDLVQKLETVFGRLHGCSLNSVVLVDSSDESLAAWLMGEATRRIAPCMRVTVENDGQRGAEITL